MPNSCPNDTYVVRHRITCVGVKIGVKSASGDHMEGAYVKEIHNAGTDIF